MNATVYILWCEDTREGCDNMVVDAFSKEEDASAELRRLFVKEMEITNEEDVVDSFVGPLHAYIETHDGEVDYHVKALEVK